MKKRIILWLSVLLIALLPAMGGLAEEAVESVSSAEPDVRVLYVPRAGNESDEIVTAQYVAEAIRGSLNGKKAQWYRTTGDKGIQDDPFSAKSWFAISNAPSLLSEAVRNAIPAGDPHELWVIVPEAASDVIVNDGEWTEYFGSLLEGNESTRLRIVFIGSNAYIPTMPRNMQQAEELSVSEPTVEADFRTGMEKLAVAYPGRIEWVVLRNNFTEERTDQKTVHTGDYFIASLFGTPVDLTVNGDYGTFSFAVPSVNDGQINIAVVQKNTAGRNQQPKVIWNAESVVSTQAFSMPKINNNPSYNVVYLTNVAPGTYTVAAEAGDIVKAYWYPDFSNDLGAQLVLEPAPDSEDGTWNRSTKTISIQVGNDLQRFADFRYGFEILVDGTNCSPENEHIQADAMSGRWTYQLDVNQDVKESVSVKPALSLSMTDGNLIWEMPGETREIRIADGDLTAKELAQEDKAFSLYIYGEASNSLSKNWTDFFDYNMNDAPKLSAEAAEDAPLTVVENQDQTGFTVAVNKDARPGEYAVVLKGKNPKDGQDVLCGITVNVADANALLQDIQITATPDGAEIDAGSVIHVKVSCNQPEEWKKAKEAIDAFPAWENLTVTATLGDREPVQLQLNGGNWETDQLKAPVDSENVKLSVKVFTGDAEESTPIGGIPGAEKEWIVVNTAPEYMGTVSKEQEIEIDGWPDFVPFFGGYKEFNLLDKAGLTDAWSLFEEKETPESLTVIVEIRPVGQLRIEEHPQTAVTAAEAEASETGSSETETSGTETAETEASPEETGAATGTEKAVTNNDVRIYTLTADDPKIPDTIYALKPGDYTVTLTAGDGVKTSEPVKITLKVKSANIDKLITAGIIFGVLILALIALLVIRQARKPKFDRIRIRCLTWSDDNQELGREMMNKTRPVPMTQFGKKPVTLNTALLLARQPVIAKELAEIAEDITLMPTKHDELNIVFGKKAMADLGQQDKKISLSQGNVQRIRLGNQYVLIENVQ